MPHFDYHGFNRKRRFLKIAGLALLVLGVFTIIDMAWKVPIPLTGSKAVFAGLVMIGLGAWSLYNGYKLPLDEAIQIIHDKGDGITTSEIIHLMRVDRMTADRIISALVEKGFLKSSSRRSETEEVFDAVK